jgi:crossover junction endodeoxyribonuclease RusA
VNSGELEEPSDRASGVDADRTADTDWDTTRRRRARDHARLLAALITGRERVETTVPLVNRDEWEPSLHAYSTAIDILRNDWDAARRARAYERARAASPFVTERFPLMELPFTVYGVPRPQGSKRHVGNGRMIESSPRVAEWRTLVAHTASIERAGQPVIEGPVTVDVVFGFGLPKQPGTRRSQDPHTQRPDLDKLVRAVLDALTGVMYTDDSQVVELSARKVWVETGQDCAVIMVQPCTKQRKEPT